MLSGWNFFKIYHAFDLHFNTEKYDVLKYGGKSRITEESFLSRNDRSRFEYWANKFHNKDAAGKMCIANFMYGDGEWLYQPHQQADEVFQKWKGIRESMTKTFDDDIHTVEKIAKKHSIDVDSLFEMTPSGKYPPLWQIINANLIKIESAVIINNEMKDFFGLWKKMAEYDPYVDDKLLKIKKYVPFVQYQKDKIHSILDGVKI
jgi:hypothetical protein